MKPILADLSASISELKKNPSALLQQAEGSPITILNHNKPTAYLIPAETYETMIELIEDYELGEIVKQRSKERSKAIEVSINDL
ncbi:MAG: type II toxin-antitoxin system Phd/YefM family antitoxin [Proteobacteria bacterium]|nr:type II toxin-antitoxin system Phd/YefM family antitoxin [Pseudomonadota bacterium]